MERFWTTVDILPQRVFSLGRLFILQLSCPGLVLTGHLGHTLGHSNEPAWPNGAHSLVEETDTPRSPLVRYMRQCGPSICRGREAWGLWGADWGDLGSATAGIQGLEG